MTGIPTWLGATSGQATQAGQVNQLLGAHAVTFIYQGTQQAAQSTVGSGAVNSNSLWIAQSFTTGSGQTAAGRVVLTLAVTSSPAPMTVGLYASSAGAPTGSALVLVSVPKEFLTGTAAALSIPLPAIVTASTTYWIVATAVGDVSNYYSWSKSNQVSGASTSANGTTWTTQAYGLLFQVYDQTANSLLTHTFEDSGARWTGLSYTGNQITTLREYTTAQASGYIQSSRTLSYSGALLTKVA
jgi:hypothetical protein